MAASSLILDTRRPNKNGEFPVKIRITHNTKNVAIRTGICISQEYWDGREVTKKHPQCKIYNNELKNLSVSIENIIRELNNTGRVAIMSASDIKIYVEKQIQECFSEKTFSDFYVNFMEGKEKTRTREIYQATFNKIKEFTKEETLLFEDINVSWLKSFENFLKKNTPSVNARSIHLRNIRAVFNSAIEEEIIRLDLYPFRKFKIKREKTQKRAMTIEELIKFRDYPCEEHQKLYQDIFMLMFYLIGINMIDLCNLKGIDGERINYKRAKTSRLYSIKVEPEAERIINKYRGEKQLLNILDRYENYRNFTWRMNKNLHEIGEMKLVNKKIKGKTRQIKERTPLFPQISTYWARHTWATIAASLDIPKETIAAALGHGGNTVTDIYIDFVQKKIDKANRKIIDFVNNYKKK